MKLSGVVGTAAFVKPYIGGKSAWARAFVMWSYNYYRYSTIEG